MFSPSEFYPGNRVFSHGVLDAGTVTKIGDDYVVVVWDERGVKWHYPRVSGNLHHAEPISAEALTL